MLSGEWQEDSCKRALLAAIRGLKKLQVRGEGAGAGWFHESAFMLSHTHLTLEPGGGRAGGGRWRPCSLVPRPAPAGLEDGSQGQRPGHECGADGAAGSDGAEDGAQAARLPVTERVRHWAGGSDHTYTQAVALKAHHYIKSL